MARATLRNLRLTDAGKGQREIIFELQSEVRRRAMQGITEQEYTTLIDVLQRVVKNLEMSKETPACVTPSFRELDVC